MNYNVVHSATTGFNPLDNKIAKPLKSSHSSLEEWAITINVHTEKKVSKMFWKQILPKNQETVLDKLMSKIKNKFDITIEYIFELTKKGHTHLHGKFSIHPDKSYMIEQLQQLVHNTLGVRYLNPSIVCHLEQTLLCISHWNEYMRKEMIPQIENLLTPIVKTALSLE